jgi:hypothetical protein
MTFQRWKVPPFLQKFQAATKNGFYPGEMSPFSPNSSDMTECSLILIVHWN